MPNHTNIDKDFINAVMTGFDETLSTDIQEAIDNEIIAKLRKIAEMMKKAEAGWVLNFTDEAYTMFLLKWG